MMVACNCQLPMPEAVCRSIPSEETIGIKQSCLIVGYNIATVLKQPLYFNAARHGEGPLQPVMSLLSQSQLVPKETHFQNEVEQKVHMILFAVLMQLQNPCICMTA
jgi:hypothetical protein